jgi:hypothetical protein
VQAARRARRASLGLESVEPPHECTSPITLELVRDPVAMSDGHSYGHSCGHRYASDPVVMSDGHSYASIEEALRRTAG